jgi:hypothetical protein
MIELKRHGRSQAATAEAHTLHGDVLHAQG